MEEPQYKQLTIKLTKSKFDEWSKLAKKKGISLYEYVRDSVEEKGLRKNMIDYLQLATSHDLLEEKKFYKY